MNSRVRIAPPGETVRILTEKELDRRRFLRRGSLGWMNKMREYRPTIYGSIARGDVKESSDADIIIDPIPSFKYELILDQKWLSRSIVQATPNHTPKTVYELTNDIHLTVPFLPLSEREMDFVSFGGKLSLSRFQNGDYAVGINKALQLVEPVDQKGFSFKYTSLKSIPVHIAARKANCGVDVITERIRVLSKREEVGRKGLYVNEIIHESEQPEEALRRIAAINPGIRRILAHFGLH